MQEILKKFRFKGPGVVLHAPSVMEDELVKLGFKTSFPKDAASTNTLVFVADETALLQFLTNELRSVAPDSVLWLAYPKQTSKLKTAINRDTIRQTCEEFGITTVTAISIDDTWSALRFRPVDKVGT